MNFKLDVENIKIFIIFIEFFYIDKIEIIY